MAIDAPPRIDAKPASAERVEAFPPGYGDPGLRWLRMPYDEFLRLPEKPKAEWFDGWAVIHVDMPKPPHARASQNLFLLLNKALPRLGVAHEWGFRIGTTIMRPDIIAFHPDAPDEDALNVPPIFAVEVLSPSTRNYDLIMKSEKYLAMGVRQYWTVDPESEEIVVRENATDRWQEIAIIDAAHPTADISIGEYGDATVNHAEVFAPRFNNAG